MKTKLFILSVLAIALLSSCEKTVGTYTFSDGVTITKYQKGNEVRYESNKGSIDRACGNVLMVKEHNFSKSFGDERDYAQYFTGVYNITLPDPIMSLNEYFVVVRAYPKTGVFVATKGGKHAGKVYSTLRTFDGNTFVFPFTPEYNKIDYDLISTHEISVDDDSGKISINRFSASGEYYFYLSNINPEQIKDKKIYFDFQKNQSK